MEQNQIDKVLLSRNEMATDSVYSYWLFYCTMDSMLSTEDFTVPLFFSCIYPFFNFRFIIPTYFIHLYIKTTSAASLLISYSLKRNQTMISELSSCFMKAVSSYFNYFASILCFSRSFRNPIILREHDNDRGEQ